MDKYCKYCESYIDVNDEELYIEDEQGNIFCCEEHYDLYWYGDDEEVEDEKMV